MRELDNILTPKVDCPESKEPSPKDHSKALPTIDLFLNPNRWVGHSNILMRNLETPAYKLFAKVGRALKSSQKGCWKRVVKIVY